MRAGMICSVAYCLLLSVVAAGQARPEFEVASIRPSSELPAQVDVGVHVSGSQVRITGMSLRDYIRIAYRVSPRQVSGPDWKSTSTIWRSRGGSLLSMRIISPIKRYICSVCYICSVNAR